MYKALKFYTPIIVLVILVLSYAVLDAVFVNCRIFDSVCTRMEAKHISRILPSSTEKTETPDGLCSAEGSVQPGQRHCLGKIDETLKELEAELISKDELVKGQETLLNSTRETIAKWTRTQSDAAIINPSLPADDVTPTKLNASLESQKATLAALDADRTKVRNEIISIRNQVAERYSKRMLWIFLSGLYFLLSIGAVVISISTIKETLSSLNKSGFQNRWQLITFVSAAAISLFVLLRWESYMGFVGPMYKQSITSYGDINIWAISFFNAIGFFATAWLMSAGTAVYYVARVKTPPFPEDGTPLPPLESSARRGIISYEKLLTYLLYVGAMMLFVGMLRLKLQYDWHLVFVSTDVQDKFYLLLSEYSKSSIGVQAGFYSLLLGTIYLPGKYALEALKERVMPDQPVTGTMEASSNLLQKLGLPFSNDFLAKVLAVFSPVLAGPIIELFKFMIGNSA